MDTRIPYMDLITAHSECLLLKQQQQQQQLAATVSRDRTEHCSFLAAFAKIHGTTVNGI